MRISRLTQFLRPTVALIPVRLYTKKPTRFEYARTVEHPSVARVLADSSEEISRRWLDRLTARIAVEQSFVFPSEDLLDGIPFLIESIARHVGHEESEIAANLAAQLKARELGRLRYHQGFKIGRAHV